MLEVGQEAEYELRHLDPQYVKGLGHVQLGETGQTPGKAGGGENCSDCCTCIFSFFLLFRWDY